MTDLQHEYDEAMYRFSTGDFAGAMVTLKRMLEEEPSHFETQLALGMAYYRLGDYRAAIREGHKAERLNPLEQLVHTNLSLFYMKAGDRATAERHGLEARIAAWRTGVERTKSGAPPPPRDPELELAKTQPQQAKPAGKSRKETEARTAEGPENKRPAQT
jgi:tetratricopeptide (TPR) repeat protein